MSWDVFVQDLPNDAKTVGDIPGEFVPKPLGKRSKIIAAIREVAPDVDFGDRGWAQIEGEGFSIEINLGNDEPIQDFAFHVTGSGPATEVLAAILDRLRLRALDPGSETGFFEAGPSSENSFSNWQRYRDHAFGDDAV